MKIPMHAFEQHTAIVGKTGSGKTYAAKGIVERFLADHRQVCIVDPTSAWWGLRLKPDGSRGYDVVILGGEHGDLPISDRGGAAAARLITEQLASVVVDTGGMTVGQYTRFAIDFFGTLYTTIHQPLHLVIDEAHTFMPQSGGGRMDVDAGKMLHVASRLVSGGRSRGFRAMLITQRPAKIHKDPFTCADCLVAMRVLAPQDRAAVKAWIDGAADPVLGKQVLDSLATMPRGEGWVWYPEGDFLERVTFPKIETYDSSAAPKHGKAQAVTLGEIDLEKVKAAMAAAVAEAEANDPKILRRRIAELEKAVAEKAAGNGHAPHDTREIERLTEDLRIQTAAAREAIAGLEYHASRCEVMQAALDRVKAAADIDDMLPPPLPSMTTFKGAGRAFRKSDAISIPHRSMVKSSFRSGDLPPDQTHGDHAAKPVRKRAPIIPRDIPVQTDASLPPGEAKILTAILQRGGCSREALTVMTGYKRSSRDTFIQRLRARGLVEVAGDRIEQTAASLAALPDYEPLPTGGALLAHYIDTLPQGESLVLACLPGGGHALSREEIANRTGYKRSSRDTYIQRLRSRGLIEVDSSGIRLHEDLR